MKKVVFGSLFLALVGIGTVGCKKENTLTNNVTPITNEISKNNDVLRFETIQSYENFVSSSDTTERAKTLASIKGSKFQNYFSVKSNEFVAKSGADNSAEMDDFLGQLLNKDGAIVIGENLFKVDLSKESVYVIKYNTNDDYNVTINKLNSLDKEVKVFSTDDDVLDLIQNDGFEGKSCGGSDSFDLYGDKYITDGGNTSYIVFRTKYFKAGVYFRVTVQTGTSTVSGTGIQNAVYSYQMVDDPNPSNNYKAFRLHKRPCGSGDKFYWSAGWYSISNNGVNEFYSNIRGLNGYRVKIIGKVNFKSTDFIFTDGWGLPIGREVNTNF